MRAIDRENLELLTIYVTYPAGNIRGFPIQWIRGWITINRHARLARGKLTQRAERNPGIVSRSPLAAKYGR
jgi:hypothetical protein